MTPFRWTAAHLRPLLASGWDAPGVIGAEDVARITPGLDLWDHWPVLEENGRLATVAGGLLVIALSAPTCPDPDARHAVARLRLLHRRGSVWDDLGPLLPDGFSPGSREWAGSAVVDPGRQRLTLFFTAAGRRGETAVAFEQRLFRTCARLVIGDGTIGLSDWTAPVELVRPDGVRYATELVGAGGVGTIKAFRDPFVFRDPAGGAEHLLFAASHAGDSAWNGLVGLARREGERWTLLDPLVDADGLCNELERPHLVEHDGRLYVFWSSQASVFAPGIAAPTGLYGVVADLLAGPWRPLNGTGLVFGNPVAADAQAYSWQVLPDLSVWSFADRPVGPSPAASAVFVGAPAPALRIGLDEDRAVLIG